MYSIEVSMLYTYTYAYLYLYMAYTYIHTVPKPTYLPYIHENGESLLCTSRTIALDGSTRWPQTTRIQMVQLVSKNDIGTPSMEDLGNFY